MTSSADKTSLTLGFVPLTDCALLAVARERGLFAAEGLDVTLSREASWANIRDKVVSGVLDGAHMLAPMAIASALGAEGPACPMIAPMALNVNGSSIGISTALAQQIDAVEVPGASLSAQGLKTVIERMAASGEGPLTFAVVYPFSIHNYMLRYWLAAAGIDPDRDVRITVVPPPRIAARVAAGDIDGFGVGAPWGGAVEAAGVGRMVLHGAQFWTGAPDKVLGVTQTWADANPQTLLAVVRALIRAATWADDPGNEAELAAMLATEAYVGAPASDLSSALSKSNPFGLRFQSGNAAYPRPAHARWLLSQMERWRQVGPGEGRETAAGAVYRPDLYLQAAQAVGVALPPADIDQTALAPLFDADGFGSTTALNGLE